MRIPGLVLLATLVGGCDDGGDDDAPPAADAGAPDATPGCEPFAPLVLGGDGRDGVHALARAQDGTIVVGGYERGGVPDRFEVDGDSLGLVAGFAPDGAPSWRQELDTPATDVVDALLADGAAIYVTGHTAGSLPGQVNAGQRDAFLARIDPTGAALVVLDQQGSERPQRPRRLLRHGDELVLAGWDDTYVPTNYVEDWEDPLLVRWRLVAGGVERVGYTTWNTEAPDVMYTAASLGEDLLLGGNASSGADKGAWLVRLPPAGTRAWTTRLSPVAYDTVVAVFPDGDELVVVGTAFAPAGEPTAGEQDVYVARVDAASGERTTQRWVGSAASDWVVDAVRAADGRLFVLGESPAPVAPGLTVLGSNDVFVLELAADGTPRAAWQGGTMEDDFASALLIDETCGRVLVGATVTGVAAGGPGTANGGLDGVVWQVALTPVAP